MARLTIVLQAGGFVEINLTKESAANFEKATSFTDSSLHEQLLPLNYSGAHIQKSSKIVGGNLLKISYSSMGRALLDVEFDLSADGRSPVDLLDPGRVKATVYHLDGKVEESSDPQIMFRALFGQYSAEGLVNKDIGESGS